MGRRGVFAGMKNGAQGNGLAGVRKNGGDEHAATINIEPFLSANENVSVTDDRISSIKHEIKSGKNSGVVTAVSLSNVPYALPGSKRPKWTYALQRWV